MKFRVNALTGAFAAACVFAFSATATTPIAAAQEAQSAETPEDIAIRFGIRSSVLDISLSPSGRMLAWIAPGPNHAEILKVLDLDGNTEIASIVSNTEITADLNQCDWVTDTRLLCDVFGMTKRSDGVLLPYDRMFAVNFDGSGLERLHDRRSRRAMGFNQDGGDIVALDVPGAPGQVLITPPS